VGTIKKSTEIRQEEIARAALHLISRHGMKGLSMVRVSRHVGLVPSAIYRHFQNKEALFNAVFDLIEQTMQANFLEAWTSSARIIERLHMLLRLNVRMIIQYPAIPRVVFGEGIYGTDTARRARTYGLIQSYLVRIENAVAAAQRENEIRTDISASVIAAGFWGLIPPAALLWSASEGSYDITTLVEREWTLFEEIATLHQHRDGTKAARND
jgi:AcrR family transcriptional regulator